jgi:hypothetical protein
MPDEEIPDENPPPPDTRPRYDAEFPVSVMGDAASWTDIGFTIHDPAAGATTVTVTMAPGWTHHKGRTGTDQLWDGFGKPRFILTPTALIPINEETAHLY